MYFKWIYEMFKKDWCDGNMAGLKRTTFFVNQKQSQSTMKILSITNIYFLYFMLFHNSSIILTQNVLMYHKKASFYF